jgi:sorbitol/mannitol transport system substrate-binding protein
MPVSRRSVFGMTAAVLLSSSAAGCAGGTSPTTSTGSASAAGTKKIVIASVNNAPMVTLSQLAPEFTKATGIAVEFVMLTEVDIRSKIQQDVAVKGGQFDVVTLGSSDGGTYLDAGWTIPLQPKVDAMSAAEQATYDFNDLIKANISAYSSQKGGLAALPFYGESTMIMYRKDLFDAAGLTMPEQPTWDQVYGFATKLNDPNTGTVGMAIRGKAGYGENMYVFNTIMYGYGAQIVDTKWQPQYQTPAMTAAWEFYRKLQKDAGAKEASSNGYTETLNLMSSGKAGIYYDATVSADTFEKDGSAIKGKMGYALSPSGPGKGNTQTVGGWGVAIPSSSKNQDAAFKFITWATSKDYVNLVAQKSGWLSTPTGARTSTYTNPEYQKLAPYAPLVLKSLQSVEFAHPAVGDTPYTGNSLPNIAEWSSMGETIGQTLSNYIASNTATADALAQAQKIAVQAMKDGGRI